MTDLRDEIMDAWDDVLSPLFDELSTDVSVELFDKGVTTTDDLYDEAADEKVYMSPVTINGRVKIEKERLTMPGGGYLDVDGRMTFKTKDLTLNALDLDFSTRIGFSGSNYSVVHIERSSQVAGEFLLTRIFIKGI